MKRIYNDRIDAAEALSALLPEARMQKEAWIVTAVEKGGVVIADALARRLNLEVEWLMGESIVAPANEACELGRVSETEEIVINDALVRSFDIQYDYIYGEAHRRHEEKILAAIYHFRKGRPLRDFGGRNVLLVDEGTESGLKLMCAVKSVLKMNPNALYVGTPVMPTEVHEALEPLCDAVFCPNVLDDYIETSCYYSTLDKVSDETIITILGD